MCLFIKRMTKTKVPAWKEDAVRRTIKLLDIGWTAAAYFIMAVATVFAMQWALGRFDKAEAEKKSTGRLMLELVLRVWLIGLAAYVARNLYAMLPWPLEGIYGYQHMLVKEVTNGAVFMGFVAVFDTYLQGQVALLKERFGLATATAHKV